MNHRMLPLVFALVIAVLVPAVAVRADIAPEPPDPPSSPTAAVVPPAPVDVGDIPPLPTPTEAMDEGKSEDECPLPWPAVTGGLVLLLVAGLLFWQQRRRPKA